MLTGGVAPLFWWFSDGLVSALVSSGISISLVWEKITIGREIFSSSPSATSCISSSSMMCSARSSVLAGLVGGFLANLT